LSESVQRRWQHEDRDRPRANRFNLSRSLIVNIKQDTLLSFCFAPFYFTKAGSVKISVDLGPLGEGILLNQPSKLGPINKIVMNTFDF
jgi:hypothetical protein